MGILFNKDDRFKQGLFYPRNKDKFMGKFAVYRSSLELKFMKWADANPNVLEWGSENIIVPFRSPIDQKIHRYYVDNYVVIKEGTKINKYLIEIKPYKHTIPPKPSKKKKRDTVIYENVQWLVNQAKWEAATAFAESRGAKFIKLTENELPKD